MTEWPAAVDRRYHDAVIFDLDGLVADTASGGVRAFDSTVPLLRRLREVGAAPAVYSCGRNCAEVLHAAGIDEFVRLQGSAAS
jgi:alpha,alpha-trehalase